jgi:NAD(P)H-nitrite reductase large subunit
MRTSAVKYEMNMKHIHNYGKYEINTKTCPKSQTCKFMRSDAAFEIDTRLRQQRKTDGEVCGWPGGGAGAQAWVALL